MNSSTDIEHLLSDFNFFLESKKYIEDETDLFTIHILGFPWYKVAIERMLNMGSSILPQEDHDENPKKTRLNDFKDKKYLLDSKFEYAFFTKSRQYRRDKNQKENHIFLDIYKNLKNRNIPFIIFDIPDNSNLYDTRYFESVFYKQTIPYEYAISLLSPQEINTINDLLDVFSKKTSTLFHKTKINEKYRTFYRLLFQSYNSLAKGIIPNLFTYKKLLHNMKIKCLFGAMGTQDLAGIDNNFCVCEVGHGIGKRNNYTNERLISFYRAKFHVKKLFFLEFNITNKSYKENKDNHFPFLMENILNFGMPEIRNYKISEQKIISLKNEYNIHEKKSILILTAAGKFNEDIKKLISCINVCIPNTFILLRQHPRYDTKINIKNIKNFALVNELNLFDCICMADIVITPPNNTSHEASFFTNNIIIYPHRSDANVDSLRQIYENKFTVIDIRNTHVVLKKIEEMLIKKTDTSSHKTFNHDIMKDSLDILFSKIEYATSDNKTNTHLGMQKNKTNGDFINPCLNHEFCDKYIVRSSIFENINKNICLFHGALLDVGCGQMPYREHILSKNPNITRYIGLDFAQGKYADLRQPDLTWDGHTIPLADASVDCAMATEVLEHCFDPSLVLQEIKRVLKPGGVFFFTTPFLWPIHDAPHDHYRYTPYALEKLLTEAGFADIRIEAMGGWNASLAQMIGLWLRRAPMSEDVRSQMTKDLFPFLTELIRTDAIPSDFAKNPMITGLAGTARVPASSAAKIPHMDSPRVIVITDQFPVLSQTFILDQMTGLIDRGLGVEHWSLQRMDEPVIHENVHKYGLLESTRYISLPPDALRADPARWTEQFLRTNNLPALDNVASVQIHFGPNFNKLAPLFETYPDLFVLVSFHGYDGSATFKVKGADVYAGLFVRANQITTPSQYMKSTLIQYGCPADKIVVHHYGKDTTIFAPTPRPGSGPVRLLSVARFVEKKGLEYSLKGFAKAQAGLNAQYRIIGYGPQETELKKLVHSLGVEEQVVFLGQLTNDAVRKEMSAADIFVLTSVTAANGDQEGVPVSLIEAHALGLPVVSSLHAGIPELVAHGETGFLAEERNVEEIAGYLRALIKNPTIRTTFSANARQKVLREFDLTTLNDTLAETLTRQRTDHRRDARSGSRQDASSGASGEESHPGTVYCPICRSQHDQFHPFGKPPRPNAMCPNCTSLERHRAIWLFLERHTDFFTSPGLRMLHFAPEACLEPRFRHLMGKRYVTADLLNPRADIRADITNLQFPDASFDAVLCSHVLEHVPDDHAAMRELYRILDKDGVALIMVPLKGDITEEDLTVTDPEERIRRYGQADHVRYYGMDITSRLQAVGFAVQCIDTATICDPADFARMRFSREKIFLCRKQPKSNTADTDTAAISRNATDLPPKTTAQALSATARHWSSVKTTPRTRWWMHPVILRHINAVVCGEALEGPWAGLEQRMRGLLNKSFARGLSVGCGGASKELHLLQEGIVGHFDLFEISPERIALGQASAARRAVTDRAHFHAQDAFAQDLDDQYDLVYWNNALHHMFDVRQALHWSRDRLRPGGWLVMDDYVGATRFQWPDTQLEIASQVRRSLPARLLRDPAQPHRNCATSLRRPDLAGMLATDPSEAADSDNIIPALREIFPEAQIMLTGGVVYNLALKDIIANFDDAEDAARLQDLLAYDAKLASQGHTQYACAFAER